MAYGNVAEPFLKTVREHPDKTAVVFKRTELSYGAMNRRINQLAHLLAEQEDVQPGDRVAYLLPNGFDVLEVYYAVQKIGAVAVPLNFKLIPREVAYLVNASGASVLLYDLQFDGKVKAACESMDVRLLCCGGGAEGACDVYDACKTASEEEPPLFRDPQALSRIQYTGGSTGVPKGAARTHAADLVELAGVLESNGLAKSPDNVVLIQCPLEHHGGHSWFTSTFAAAATLVVCDAFNAEKILYKIDHYRVTYMLLLPPATYLRMLDSPFKDSYDLSSVRLVQSAAGNTTRRIIERIYECFPNAILNYGWGQSESGLGSSLVIHRSWLENDDPRLESVGTPMPFAQMRIVDTHGHNVAPGETGEALIKTGALMQGYYGEPDLTCKAFTADGWLRTGDMMSCDAQGYYYVRGRKKDMIKSGGENVFIGEVERVIDSHPEVADCVVFGTDDPIMGEAVAAVVQRTPGSQLSAQQLQDHCKAYISSYKKPRYIVFVDSIGRDDAGKVRKQQVVDYFNAHKKAVAPRMFRMVGKNPDIAAIGIPLSSATLRQTVAYLIRGDGRDMLVDTGLCQEKSIELMRNALDALGVDMNRTDIALTHLHVDHLGMALRIAKPGTRIYLGRADADFIGNLDPITYRASEIKRFRSWGVPADAQARMYDANQAYLEAGVRPGERRFIPIDDGQLIGEGAARLQVVATPGHTPGHCCFLLPDKGTMFLGDHVMMEMTSNVVPWPGQGDMLARYLDSLQKIYAMPEMRRAYCSHGTLTDQPYPAARIRKRIAWIRRHYLRRIDEVVQALDAHPGMDGMEIASYIKWNIPFANLGDASMMQQTFIIGETMAYVEYALNRGRITREADGAVNRYFADVVKKG